MLASVINCREPAADRHIQEGKFGQWPEGSLSAEVSWRELAAGLELGDGVSSELSPAEQVVLVHLRLGITNREIAVVLGKSERTVKNQVSAILAKYGVPTRARLIALLR